LPRGHSFRNRKRAPPTGIARRRIFISTDTAVAAWPGGGPAAVEYRTLRAPSSRLAAACIWTSDRSVRGVCVFACDRERTVRENEDCDAAARQRHVVAARMFAVGHQPGEPLP